MSQDSELFKNTLNLLETDPEIKSYIYQQITEFNPFVTPETLVMVVARDPRISYAATEDLDEQGTAYVDINEEAHITQNYNYRIAIVLKEGDSAIEAEAFHNDVFGAIRLAKEQLIAQLIEIQDEIENPQDRANAIKEASDNTRIH